MSNPDLRNVAQAFVYQLKGLSPLEIAKEMNLTFLHYGTKALPDTAKARRLLGRAERIRSDYDQLVKEINKLQEGDV